jgi:hypothetical protein
MGFLDNYEDVATRIKRFWQTYPNGSIQTAIVDFNAEKGYVVIQCTVYRDLGDIKPAGVDYAYGYMAAFNPNMRRWFLEDTSTSSIGRCIGLVLGADTRATKENMSQVEGLKTSTAKTEVADVWATNYIENEMPTIGSVVENIAAQLGGEMVPESPQCSHGHRIWKTGEGKNGKAWGGFFCTEKSKATQCAPNWHVLTSDGTWKPQV